MMDASTVAILGFITLFTLMLLRVPVGMAMGLVRRGVRVIKGYHAEDREGDVEDGLHSD